MEAVNSNIQKSQQTLSWINTKKTTHYIKLIQSNNGEKNYKNNPKKKTHYTQKTE